MPLAFGYCRGLVGELTSADAQKSLITLYADARMPRHSLSQVFTDHPDQNQVPFHERPAARRLLAELERGDAMIVYSLNLACPTAKDFAQTAQRFSNCGFELHLVDPPLDLSSPEGKLALNLLVQVRQIRRRISEEQTCWKKFNRAPYPYRFMRNPKGQIIRVIDERRRKIGKQLLAWFEAGYGIEKIEELCQKTGVLFQPGRYPCHRTIRRWIEAEIIQRLMEQDQQAQEESHDDK